VDALNRRRARTWLLREIHAENGDAGFSKAELDAAVGAIDDWATANATSFNQALPQPFRGAASTSLKNLLLAAVCLRRAGKAKTTEDEA